ncbi:hypothetical protein MRB53_030255 [Persea americana]|uniref:Uncharacterized protein n=1 Tax=Persea americana TaxID=3435 RepID=A0ACC2KL13_PERAE|nr:hypothetical protein MRB53_030255 [Persea americana]
MAKANNTSVMFFNLALMLSLLLIIPMAEAKLFSNGASKSKRCKLKDRVSGRIVTRKSIDHYLTESLVLLLVSFAGFLWQLFRYGVYEQLVAVILANVGLDWNQAETVRVWGEEGFCGDPRNYVNEAKGIGEMGPFVLLAFEMGSYVGD